MGGYAVLTLEIKSVVVLTFLKYRIAPKCSISDKLGPNFGIDVLLQSIFVFLYLDNFDDQAEGEWHGEEDEEHRDDH